MALENEMLTYIASGFDEEKKRVDVKDFLVYVDSRLKSLNRISIEIDPAKVPNYSFKTQAK